MHCSAVQAQQRQQHRECWICRPGYKGGLEGDEDLIGPLPDAAIRITELAIGGVHCVPGGIGDGTEEGPWQGQAHLLYPGRRDDKVAAGGLGLWCQTADWLLWNGALATGHRLEVGVQREPSG
eukprot:gene5280-biopygen4663